MFGSSITSTRFTMLGWFSIFIMDTCLKRKKNKKCNGVKQLNTVCNRKCSLLTCKIRIRSYATRLRMQCAIILPVTKYQYTMLLHLYKKTSIDSNNISTLNPPTYSMGHLFNLLWLAQDYEWISSIRKRNEATNLFMVVIVVRMSYKNHMSNKT